MRLLLVEDNVTLADELCASLKQQGYAVDWLTDGRDAVVQGATEPYDLVILDLGLPGMPGLDILRQWRKDGLSLAVLILTARSSWSERVDGLQAGADDYLCKPVHPDELRRRSRALRRRSHGHSNNSQLEVKGVRLDERRQTVLLPSGETELTAAEFALLRYFMLHPGQLLSKSQLQDHLYDGEAEPDSNVVEVHVSHLRRKLGRHCIQTRRGQGYRFIGLN